VPAGRRLVVPPLLLLLLLLLLDDDAVLPYVVDEPKLSSSKLVVWELLLLLLALLSDDDGETTGSVADGREFPQVTQGQQGRGRSRDDPRDRRIRIRRPGVQVVERPDCLATTLVRRV